MLVASGRWLGLPVFLGAHLLQRLSCSFLVSERQAQLEIAGQQRQRGNIHTKQIKNFNVLRNYSFIEYRIFLPRLLNIAKDSWLTCFRRPPFMSSTLHCWDII